jgi:hypothetical protein
MIELSFKLMGDGFCVALRQLTVRAERVDDRRLLTNCFEAGVVGEWLQQRTGRDTGMATSSSINEVATGLASTFSGQLLARIIHEAHGLAL